MYVLKDLWQGNIAPTERSVRPGSDYKKASHEICGQLDRFLENLTPEERRQWEAVSDLQNDMAAMVEEDAFIYGFRPGARMMLDIVGEYRGPFIENGQ